MEFKECLDKYANIVNKELLKYTTLEEVPEKDLDKAVNYALISNAKRLRPILILATYNLFREDNEKCFPYMVAIEMIHNFSLIHDDLPGIDNDDFRHGKPTLHKIYNESTAILTGDRLLNYAYIVLINNLAIDDRDRDIKIRAIKELTNATDRMIIGEYIDTEYEGKPISNDYLEYMHRNKTGALLKAAVRIGAILAECPEEDLGRLTRYAESIGLAFQIKDDILSEIGTEEELGKPVGNDREKGKCTYVTKYGLDNAKNMLHEEIKKAISEINIFGDKAMFLIELAHYIENRKK